MVIYTNANTQFVKSNLITDMFNRVIVNLNIQDMVLWDSCQKKDPSDIVVSVKHFQKMMSLNQFI